MFKIIIADDEPVIIRGLKKMMNWERLNAEVIGEAANGEELLKKTEELKPDIIISDVAMPRKTGLDVIRQIRENGWKIKVIFLSGYQEFDYVKKAISYEAVDYLLKPVGQEELEQSILRAEKMLRTDSPMEYWEEEKDDMQTVFKKINSEFSNRHPAVYRLLPLLLHEYNTYTYEAGADQQFCLCCTVPKSVFSHPPPSPADKGSQVPEA